MRTRTTTPAQDLATRLYSVDFALERKLRGDAAAETTPLQHAVYLALHGNRTAEEKMANCESWIRGDLERVQRSIDNGSSTYGARIGRNAAEYDAAADLREVHRATLAALIGDEAFAEWNDARIAARTAPAETAAGTETA